MIPRRVAAPTEELVSLDEAKAHCRIDGDDSDNLIQGYIDAAMAHFDGYRGILGRCIMPQDWEVDLPGPGQHRLPFPDVTRASATNTDDAKVACTLGQDARGSSVIVSAAATVLFTAALPDELLPAVRVAVLLLVGHWFENREAVSGSAMHNLPMAVDSVLAPIRWWEP